MNFKVEETGSLTVITITNSRLDAAVAPELKELVSELVNRGRTQLLLDFDLVEFMDSSGLGSVVSALKTVGTGDMVVCCLHGIVEEVFKLTRMDRVFTIRESREDGLDKLAA